MNNAGRMQMLTTKEAQLECLCYCFIDC